jgi:hypothetical protein
LRKARVHSVGRPKSFRAALKEYETSSDSGDNPDLRAHLQRWQEDDRSETVWREIEGGAQKNNTPLPATLFIREMLGARAVAIAIGNRGKLRKDYREAADQMQRIANFLRSPHPYGMPSHPRTQDLARMLDDAATYFRKQVEPTRKLPGILRFSRQAKPETIFMSMVGNYLKDITERWLDKEVAVLADIAFDSPEPIEPEAARWARGLRGTARSSHKRRR